MAQGLLFAASALLCLALGESLECSECLLLVYNVGCLPGFGKCTTQDGQPCMAITISHKDKEMYHIYGCSTPGSFRCGASKEYYDQQVNVKCCSDSDMCNRRFKKDADFSLPEILK